MKLRNLRIFPRFLSFTRKILDDFQVCRCCFGENIDFFFVSLQFGGTSFFRGTVSLDVSKRNTFYRPKLTKFVFASHRHRQRRQQRRRQRPRPQVPCLPCREASSVCATLAASCLVRRPLATVLAVAHPAPAGGEEDALCAFWRQSKAALFAALHVMWGPSRTQSHGDRRRTLLPSTSNCPWKKKMSSGRGCGHTGFALCLACRRRRLRRGRARHQELALCRSWQHRRWERRGRGFQKRTRPWATKTQKNFSPPSRLFIVRSAWANRATPSCPNTRVRQGAFSTAR